MTKRPKPKAERRWALYFPEHGTTEVGRRDTTGRKARAWCAFFGQSARLIRVTVTPCRTRRRA